MLNLPPPTLYAALLLGYTIHFIYCIWGNLSLCGNDLQGPKGGPAVVLLPHIVVIAVPVLQLRQLVPRQHVRHWR